MTPAKRQGGTHTHWSVLKEQEENKGTEVVSELLLLLKMTGRMLGQQLLGESLRSAAPGREGFCEALL